MDEIIAALVKAFTDAPNLRKACPRCTALATIHPDADTPGTFELRWSRPGQPNFEGGEREWKSTNVTLQEFMDPEDGCGFDAP